MIFIFKSKIKLWKLPTKEPPSEPLFKISSVTISKTKPLMSGALAISPTNIQKPSFQVQLPSYQSLLPQLKTSVTGHPRTKCHTRERTLLMIFIYKPKMLMRLVLKMLDYKPPKCKLKWTEPSLMLMPRELNNKCNMKKTSRTMILKPSSKV